MPRKTTISQSKVSSLGESEAVESRATPFLKWAGGKRSLLKELTSRMPATFHSYWEPFVGGGALFFEVQPQLRSAFLSDVNPDLVTTYQVIKTNPEPLIERLKEHQLLHNDAYYYQQRSQHQLTSPVEIAARTIYLNKTCFNGLWRVNKKGEFNVPVGRYTNPGICQEQNIRACSAALQQAVVEQKTFHQIEPQAGDFVYFDPPYHPVNNTSFTAYGAGNFTEADQLTLAHFCTHLHEKGVQLMVSNSHTPFIKSIYASPIFNIRIVHAPRMVNSKANGRNAVEEVLITNY